MPRKGQAPKREVGPDLLFESPVVHKLVNKIMMRGKKSVAERIVYGAFDQVKEKAGQDPVGVLDKALRNIM
ncbi:MAG: 30S ribosomal protein S7, partial [bacterium]